MTKSGSRQLKNPTTRKARLTPLPEPKFAPMPVWCALSGVGKTTSYQLVAAGYLPARKLGKRLLIDVDAGLRYLRSLPAADVTLPNSRTIADAPTA
jgi:hypothetical protein